MSTDYAIEEITVTGTFKNWSDPRTQSSGTSGGSEFAMTAVPVDGEPWTTQEAEAVAFEIRMKIHVILMADAQNRGVELPRDAQNTLIQYREKVMMLKQRVGGSSWKDADVPPPGETVESLAL